MLEYERLDHIMAHMRIHQTATVKELSQLLYASESTIRRDLSELQRKGLLKRMHGGAAVLDDTTHELPLYVREQQNAQAKRIMAEKAARHIRDGQVIFLDASSTVMFLIRYFNEHENLTIITNGIKTAHELQGLQHHIYCTGGLMLHHSSAYVGEYASSFIRNFNADVFFFSSRGLSEDGKITDTSADETQIRKAMFEQSRQRIFLCDQSKVGHTYCYNLCTLVQTDAYISDQDIYSNHQE